MRRAVVASVAGLGVVGSLLAPASLPVATPAAGVATSLLPPAPAQPRMLFSGALSAGSADSAVDVWDVVPADGSQVRRRVDSTTPTSPLLADTDPSYSPDGTRAVLASDVVVGELSGRRLVVADLAGPEAPPEPLPSAWEPGTWDAEPDWSSDGASVVFTREVVDELGEYVGTRLRVVDVATGEVADPFAEAGLDADLIGSAFSPAWSPDGTRIAFTAGIEGDVGELWVLDTEADEVHSVSVETDEGLERVVGQGPVWSPDGTRIGYVDAGTGALVAGALGEVVATEEDLRILADPVPLYTPPPEEEGLDDLADPAWSPDGSELTVRAWEVVAGEAPDVLGLYAVAVEDGAYRPVLSGALPWDLLAGPDYQPWSDLAVDLETSQTSGIGLGELVELTATVTSTGPSTAWGVTVELELPGAAEGLDTAVGWPEGCTGDGGYLTCVLEEPLPAGESAELTVTVALGEPGSYRADARATADTVDPLTADNVAAVVLDAPFPAAVGTEPRLAFSFLHGRFEDRRVDVADVLAADASDFRILVETDGEDPPGEPVPAPSPSARPVDREPSYSPDGRRVVLSSQPTSEDGSVSLTPTLVVADVGPGPGGATNLEVLDAVTQEGAAATRPAWSPDGTRVAFLRQTGEGWPELAVLELATGSVAEWQQPATDVSWSPDGEHLVVSAPAGSADAALLVVDPDDGTTRRVLTEVPGCTGGTEGCLTSVDGQDPAWSPDGSLVAFTANVPGGGVGLLTVPLGTPTTTSGGEVVHLVPPPVLVAELADEGYPSLRQPAWALDSGAVTVVGSEWEGTADLLTVPLDGGAPTVLRGDFPGIEAAVADPVYQPWADVAVELSATPPVDAGQVAVVVATVTNLGPSPAWSVVVDVEVPAVAAGDATLEGWPAQCEPGAAGLTCTVPGALPVGQQVELVVELRPTAAGGLPVRAEASTASVDPEPGNDAAVTTLEVRVPPAPVLEPHLAFTRWADRDGGDDSRDVADVPAQGTDHARLLVNQTVTTDTGQVLHPDESHPAYSPDGTTLALSAAPVVDGALSADRRLVLGDLVREPLPAGEPPVTNLRVLGYPTEPGWSDLEPVWSPDGTRLAFTRQDSFYGIEQRVHVLDVASGQLRELALPEEVGFAGASPSWSPDGDRLAVQVTGSSEREELWVVHLDGEAWYPVGNPADGCTGSPEQCLEPVWGVTPAWSPDGTQIAAGDGPVYTDGPELSAVVVHDVAAAPVDGSYTVTDSRVLAGRPADGELPPGGLEVAWHPAWSPDGSEIAVVGRGAEASWSALYAVPAAGGTPEVRVAEWGAGLPGGYADPSYQPWSDVGLTIEVPGGDVVAGSPTVLTVVVANAGPSAAWGLTVTLALPPGQRLVEVPEGCTVSVSGTTLSCTLPGPLAAGEDVTLEVTVLLEDPGAHEVTGTVTTTTLDPVPGNDTATVVVDVAPRVPGTGVEPRLAFGYVPDLGRELPSDLADVFWADGQEFRVLADERVTDPAGPPLRAVEAHPSYAPDGRQMVFSADRELAEDGTSSVLEGRHALMVGRTQAGATGLVDVEPLDYEREPGASDEQPTWSPDGTRIAFVRQSDAGASLALVDVATGDVRLVEGLGDEGPVTGPTWSPDGTRVAVDVAGLLRVLHLDDDADTSYPVVLAPEGCGAPTGSCDEPLAGREPAWSPDGALLAFVGTDATSGREALLTVALPAAPAGDDVYRVAPPLLVTGPGSGESWTPADPDWSLDGTSLAVVGRGASATGGDVVHTVPATGGEPTVLRDEVVAGVPQGLADLDHQPWADLGVTMSVPAAQVEAGAAVDVTVTTTNHGPSPAWGVRVAVSVPGGAEHLTAVPAGCTLTGEQLACVGAEVLPVGATQTVTLPLVLDAVGSHVATAAVTSRMIDPVPENDAADLALEVTALPPLGLLADVAVSLELGQPTAWVGGDPVGATVVVTNVAAGTATDVAVTLSHPDVVEVGPDGCPLTEPCVLGTLAPGESRTVVVELGPVAAGEGTVTASVTTTALDVDAANDTAAADLEVVQPLLRLLPAVTTPGEATLAYGTDFPPGARLTLAWDRGLTAWVRPVTVGEDGTVRSPLLVLPGDELGERVATATAVVGSPGFADVEAPAMLVVPKTSAPPDFLTRG